MLTLVCIDASTPYLRISKSVIFGLNNFAHASETTDEMALELFNPYPEGISDLISTVILFFSRSVFGMAFSITALIRRELRLDSLFSKYSPTPGVTSILASTSSEIPRVEPLPVAIAFTMETAPCMTAFAAGIFKISPTMLASLLDMALFVQSKSQKNALPDQEAFPIHI